MLQTTKRHDRVRYVYTHNERSLSIIITNIDNIVRKWSLMLIPIAVIAPIISFFFHGVLITTQAARCPLRLLDHRHPQVGGTLLRFPEKLITKKEVYRTTLVKQS